MTRTITTVARPQPVGLCIHCQRSVVRLANGRIIDPEATGDDSIWRETCADHDTFTAEHEVWPAPTTPCIVWGRTGRGYEGEWYVDAWDGTYTTLAEALECCTSPNLVDADPASMVLQPYGPMLSTVAGRDYWAERAS